MLYGPYPGAVAFRISLKTLNSQNYEKKASVRALLLGNEMDEKAAADRVHDHDVCADLSERCNINITEHAAEESHREGHRCNNW